jgi:hypothetical protein
MGAAAMSSKRKPISRPPALQITPLAISLFTEMTANLMHLCTARLGRQILGARAVRRLQKMEGAARSVA